MSMDSTVVKCHLEGICINSLVYTNKVHAWSGYLFAFSARATAEEIDQVHSEVVRVAKGLGRKVHIEHEIVGKGTVSRVWNLSERAEVDHG